MSVNLDLGCGYVDHPNFIAVDKLDYGHNIIADVLIGLPFPDEYFDFVLMNHTLQMFKYDELPIVLKELRRVMKTDATLRILTPDILKFIENYCEGFKVTDNFPISKELEPNEESRVLRYMFWHGDARSGFGFSSLKDLLERNGFKNVDFGNYGECELDSRQEESLIMTCQK